MLPEPHTIPWLPGSATLLAYNCVFELSVSGRDYDRTDMDSAEIVDLESHITHHEMLGRLLGFLMLEATAPSGLDNLVREINGCVDQARLVELGLVWQNHFLRTCKFAKV